MKGRLYVGILFTFLLGSARLSAQTTSLEVTVTDIKPKKGGTIRVGLFNEKDYLKTPLQGKVVKASGTETTVVFESLPSGEYAISIIHDENENGKLDSNALGIPKEGFAFGNNASGSFGPPAYENAKVVIGDQVVKQVIKMKYF